MKSSVITTIEEAVERQKKKRVMYGELGDYKESQKVIGIDEAKDEIIILDPKGTFINYSKKGGAPFMLRHFIKNGWLFRTKSGKQK